MQSEHKTQIYLSHAEYRALRRRARAEGRSMAAVIRAAVADYLARPSDWSSDPIRSIVGIAEGDTKASASIDDVLYGEP